MCLKLGLGGKAAETPKSESRGEGGGPTGRGGKGSVVGGVMGGEEGAPLPSRSDNQVAERAFDDGIEISVIKSIFRLNITLA